MLMKTIAIPNRESSCAVNPERWVDDHRDCLFRYALLRVRRPEVAEDLVQETLYAAVRIYSTFRGKSSERTWLCGILKNKICDYVCLAVWRVSRQLILLWERLRSTRFRVFRLGLPSNFSRVLCNLLSPGML
jgi:hypothetical protein